MPLVLEDDLIESAKRDDFGLERLIVAVWPEAYRIALGILRDRGLAEDVAQDACASIARSLPALTNNSRFAAWAYKIITNHAMTAARRRPRAEALDALGASAIESDQSDVLDLQRALAALPLLQRVAMLLHYYAGLTSFEIADAAGVPASTIRFHLMLGRRALRRALAPHDATHHSKEIVSHVQ
ncbi:MAG TPA: sigma-70 family RNA polymerase sigma factor [Candidatus Baltobacteraceae bacterium]|nr:sigma-70 family RNA polymerase sigma factor [Candidatus Baltobacteraceae bacterium]